MLIAPLEEMQKRAKREKRKIKVTHYTWNEHNIVNKL